MFVPVTVTLEVAWVLKSVYRLGTDQVLDAIRGFAGLPRVLLQNAEAVERALEWADDGAQFEDALHLAMAVDVSAFVTFDRALVKRMSGRSSMPVRMA